MKKTYFWLMALVMLVTMGGFIGAAGKEVTLRYARWGIPDELSGTKVMLNAFMKANPNIKVTLEASSWDTYWEKLQTQVASDEVADVFLFDGGWYLNQFAPKGVLMDLAPLMKRDGIKKTDYYNVWDTFTYKNKIYSIPRDYNAIVMFYNKDLFAKAGIKDYPSGNMSWDQVIELAKKLTLDNKGRNANDPGFDPDNIDQYGLFVATADIDQVLETFTFQSGGQLISPDGQKFFIDSPKVKKVIQFLYDLTWKYHVKPTPAAVAKFQDVYFQTGKFAMVYQGSWQVSQLNGVTFDWDVAVAPTFGKKIYCVQSVGNSMYAKTKHPKEAWKLIRFLCGKEGQTIMAKEGDAIPVLKEVAMSPAFLNPSQKPLNKKAYFESAVGIVPYISFPKKGEIFERINQDLESAYNNKKTVEAAIKACKQDVERIINLD
ncbi:MAG TPA: sugar ABC transporter substrate-binding protein [Bacillota bacterium]